MHAIVLPLLLSQLLCGGGSMLPQALILGHMVVPGLVLQCAPVILKAVPNILKQLSAPPAPRARLKPTAPRDKRNGLLRSP